MSEFVNPPPTIEWAERPDGTAVQVLDFGPGWSPMLVPLVGEAERFARECGVRVTLPPEKEGS